MSVYYNDSDPFVCDWLENLIRKELLPDGVVDRRSIKEVMPEDVKGFTQCHFFAGIGGWAYALQLAGWGDRPVWTGSCPCQPFSIAGKQKAEADPRHLWPEWFRLIKECHPPTIFGEQVAGAIRHGWLDLVSTDLEGEGYTIGAVVLGAHSVGAPHIRQRLWFVANTNQNTEMGNIESCNYENWHTTSFIQKRANQFPRVDTAIALPRTLREWSTEPQVARLVNGISTRLERGNAAYGNAIVPVVAAEFIMAYMGG